jgi:hypothetical protein
MVSLWKTPLWLRDKAARIPNGHRYIGLLWVFSDRLFAVENSPILDDEDGTMTKIEDPTVVEAAGTLRVTTRDGVSDIGAGQAVIARKGEWVKYSTPLERGAEYIAVCIPAFSLETVHRDE